MTVERAVSGSLAGRGQEHPDTALSNRSMRLYAVDECTGKDGYPPEWHATIKHAVREEAGHRCVRCLHPYVKGAGRWSPCDEQCNHNGPVRCLSGPGGWQPDHIVPAGDLGDDAGWHVRHGNALVAEYRILRPYVAGYYAWTYLGEDLDRAETLARVDELLALELVPGA
jgi:hypothetical protein